MFKDQWWLEQLSQCGNNNNYSRKISDGNCDNNKNKDDSSNNKILELREVISSASLTLAVI